MKSLREFAEEISIRQKERQLTATELAERTGLTDQSVRAMLHGNAAPRLTNAMAVADALGLEFVLVPKAIANEMRSSTADRSPRTVLSDVERRLGMLPHGIQGNEAMLGKVRGMRSNADLLMGTLPEGLQSGAAERMGRLPDGILSEAERRLATIPSERNPEEPHDQPPATRRPRKSGGKS